jgi:perosamine synthetase
MIPIYKPYLPKEALQYAHEALDSGWISSIGEFKTKAQDKLKEVYKDSYVLLTSNGTTAGHLMIKTLLRRNKIKRFYVPNNVFIAAWNMILYEFNGDFDIIPIDCNKDTWNFDYENYKFIDEEDSCVVVVHNLGNPVNVPNLRAKFKNIKIIEDNCEGFFGEYNGVPTGTESIISTLSFFGNKNITCGEGGAVITKDPNHYEYMNYIHGQAQTSTRYVHGELGYNYRMTNVQAAILYGQLLISDDIKKKKEFVFETYKKNLSGIDKVKLQVTENNCVHSKWMFGVQIEGSEFSKSQYILKSYDIESRQMFFPLSSHNHLNVFKRDETVARKLNEEVIILPSYPELTEEHIVFICKKIKSIAQL